jgi:ABC-type phosphate transport system substrate-binding protein
MKYIKFALLVTLFFFVTESSFPASHASAPKASHKSHAPKQMVKKPQEEEEDKEIKEDGRKVINIYGSSTVSTILASYVRDIERNLNIKLNIVSSNSKDGLVALKNGEADFAMLSTNLDNFIKEIDGLDVKELKSFCIGDTNIVFIINKQNNIKSSRVDDIKAVLAGVISNWKDLGGADSEIIVVTEYPGGGIRNFVESDITYQPLTIDVKQMINSIQVIEVVGKVPSALGISASVLIEGKDVDVIRTERTLFTPLYLVCKEKTDEVAKFINFIRGYNIGGNIKKYIDQEKARDGGEEKSGHE